MHSFSLSSFVNNAIDLFIVFCYFLGERKLPKYVKRSFLFNNELEVKVWALTGNEEDITDAINSVFLFEKPTITNFHKLRKHKLLSKFIELCLKREIYTKPKSMLPYIRCTTESIQVARRKKLKKILGK